MTKEAYKRYLRSSWWRGFKQRYYKKFRYECIVCRATKKLEIHHLYYRDRDGQSILGRERFDQVCYLCRKDHERVTRGEITVKKVSW